MSSFSPAVGAEFTVETEAGPVPLRLATVRERDQVVPGAPDGWVPFSLLFIGPPDRYLDQRTWRLASEATGPIDVFLVPVGQDAAGFHYEAVFG